MKWGAQAAPQPRLSQKKNTMSGCLLVTKWPAQSGIRWPIGSSHAAPGTYGRAAGRSPARARAGDGLVS